MNMHYSLICILLILILQQDQLVNGNGIIHKIKLFKKKIKNLIQHHHYFDKIKPYFLLIHHVVFVLEFPDILINC